MINKMEDNYYEYEIVQACKKFMTDFNDINVRYVYNPFTGRKMKKGSSTFVTIFNQVKRYLENLDDEEFHSPIKIENVRVDRVPAREVKSTDKYLSKNVLETDRINHEWFKKVEKKLKLVSESKSESPEESFNITSWKYDTHFVMIQNDELEIRIVKWIQSNPELYSFIDYYKPEVFKHKYIMKHLVNSQYNFTQFTTWLQYTCDIFIKKTFERHNTAIPNEYRYAVSMILLWIYQPFVMNARKFIKKNKRMIEEFMRKIPNTQLKINKQQLCSIILAYFIRATKVEDLEKINSDSDSDRYFENCLNKALDEIKKENILTRPYYRQLLTEFLSGRIRPYRYTNVRFSNLENFDKIMEYLENPPKPKEQVIEINESKEEMSDDE
jgi:hypothetical protein